MIGRKFYDIRDHIRSKSFYRFLNGKLDVRYLKMVVKVMSDAKKISPLARKVLKFPTSLEINFGTIEVGLHCSFHSEKTSICQISQLAG